MKPLKIISSDDLSKSFLIHQDTTFTGGFERPTIWYFMGNHWRIRWAEEPVKSYFYVVTNHDCKVLITKEVYNSLLKEHAKTLHINPENYV